MSDSTPSHVDSIPAAATPSRRQEHNSLLSSGLGLNLMPFQSDNHLAGSPVGRYNKVQRNYENHTAHPTEETDHDTLWWH